MRRALIDPQGVTRNVIEVDIEASYPLASGWRLDDPVLFPLPDAGPSVPEVVSARQLKIALLAAGLLDQVEAFASTQPREVQISWQCASEFHRENELLNAMAQAFGMTAAQVDGLFMSAAQIS